MAKPAMSAAARGARTENAASRPTTAPTDAGTETGAVAEAGICR